MSFTRALVGPATAFVFLLFCFFWGWGWVGGGGGLGEAGLYHKIYKLILHDTSEACSNSKNLAQMVKCLAHQSIC